jgi:hypothetical protein
MRPAAEKKQLIGTIKKRKEDEGNASRMVYGNEIHNKINERSCSFKRSKSYQVFIPLLDPRWLSA